jgi:hypothetical protein
MLMNETNEREPTTCMPLIVAASMQDGLMTVCHDLERLDSLLGGACNELMQRFSHAAQQIRSLSTTAAERPLQQDDLTAVSADLAAAVTALQFQDMATQLIFHTRRHLQHCADQLAQQALGDDEDGTGVIEAPPLRANPVTQSEIDAGAIELF